LSNVLVVAAHPDDALLGCGATIARHAAAGDSVHIVAFADGIMGRKGPPKEERAAEFAQHTRAAQEAWRILGAASYSQLDFPDTRLDTIPQLDLALAAEEAVAFREPDIVYTHHFGDLNADHVCVHNAVCVACRPVPGSFVRALLFFEVQSSTEWGTHADPFVPNWFVDATQTIGLKLRALEAFSMEMRPFPHARSIEAVRMLAGWRGACAGIEAAEAFVLSRRIE